MDKLKKAIHFIAECLMFYPGLRHLNFLFRPRREYLMYSQSSEQWEELAPMSDIRANYGVVHLNESSFWITCQ